MKSFSELALPEELESALSAINFVEMTKIQTKAIPVLIEGRDLMVSAETGSGKTAAYSIPMIAELLKSDKKNGLILAPTRELAQQIAEFIKQLTGKIPNFQVTLLVGGQDIRKQFKQLQKKSRIVVATPGRLNDHLMRNTVQLNKTEIVVLDEGDRMLDMGFAPQLDQILKYVPKERQTSLFTATLPDKVVSLSKKYLRKPEKIIVGRGSLPVEAIKQSIVELEFKDKDDYILDELNKRSGAIIIFVKTKYRTDRLAKHLADYGHLVETIHGDRNQGQRNRAISKFKSGKVRILCATDVAARGIDVPQVEHVINFDIPTQDEDYVHRIGRTARNGAEGEAVTFVTPEEHRTWQILAKKYKIPGVELKTISRSAAKNDKKKRSGKKKSSRGGNESFADRFKRKSKSFSKKRRDSEDDEFSGRKKTKSKSKRFSRDDECSPKKKRAKSVRGSNGEDSPLRKKKKSTSGSSKKVSFKKKKTGSKTFKKSGGFKKSRAKQMSGRRSSKR